MAKPEALIQQKILKWLNLQPLTWAFKTYANPYNSKGLPDITGSIAGIRIEIEVKTPTGKVTPKQAHTLKKFNDIGTIAFVARSLDDVQQNLTSVYHAIDDGRIPIKF